MPKKKLFLSYGRADGGDLAARIQSDLENSGFEVWQDIKRIRAGAAWDDEVRSALASCDAAIALLTPQAVRTASDSEGKLDSVCLDEINYFRFHLKRPIIPVMARTCEPPLVIYRLEYVDMREWHTEEIYGAALRKLVEGVEAGLRGEIRYRSWIGELSGFDFSPLLNEKRKNFFGREWIFAEIESWLRSGRERALLLKGDPGSGKSAIVAELVQGPSQSRVLAYHCCQADVIRSLQPGEFVRSLAAMIAARLEEYAVCLSDPVVRDALVPDYCSKDPAGALDLAILAPLHRISVPIDSPRVILIDALDEALLMQQTASPLTIVDVLAARMDRLPAWLSVIATTRKDPVVLDRMRGLRSWDINTQDARNLNDVAGYIRMRLRQYQSGTLGNQSGPSLERSGRILADKCAGNFLYAQQVLDGVERGLYSLEAIERLPPGLYGLYLTFFNRYFADEQSYSSIRPVLEAMVAAREPLNEVRLATAAGANAEDELPCLLRRLGPYLRRSDAGYSFFHKSLSDWLTDSELRGTIHYISRQRGDARLAGACRTEYAATSGTSVFALRHLAAHLEGAREWDQLHELLCDFGFIERKCAAGMVRELILDCLSAARSLNAAGHPERGSDVDQFAQFVTAKAHILAGRPAKTFQEAANLPLLCLVSQRARAAETGKKRSPWLDWTNRNDAHGHLLMTLPVGAGKITALDVSPSGELIASGCEDGSLRLYSVRTGAELVVLRGHDKPVSTCAFSPDGKRVVSGAADGLLRIWDRESGEMLASLSHGHAAPLTCAFSATGLQIHSVSQYGGWIWWIAADAETGAKLRTRRSRTAASPVCFSKNLRWLGAIKDHRHVLIWNMETGKLERTSHERFYSVMALAFSPDGTRFAVSSVADKSAVLRIADAENGQTTFTIPEYAVTACAFSSDNRYLIAAYLENGLAVWDLLAAHESETDPSGFRPYHAISPAIVLPGHIGDVSCCEFFPEEGLVVSGSTDSSLKLWDISGDAQAQSLPEIAPGIPIGIKHCYSTPGDRFVCVSSQHHLYYTYANVTAYDSMSRRRPSILFSFSPQYMSGMECLSALSPLGGQLACYVASEFVILELQTGGVLARAEAEEPIRKLAYSADGEWLGVLSNGPPTLPAVSLRRLRLWDARNVSEVSQLEGDWNTFAFSPDGQVIALASNNRLRILKVPTWEAVVEVEAGLADARDIEYSPDGALLAVSFKCGVSIRGSGELEERAIIRYGRPDDEKGTAQFRFSNDSRMLATVKQDSSEIALWDTQRHIKRVSMNAGGPSVLSLAFSPDGRWLAWSTLNGLCIWDLNRGVETASFTADGTIHAIAWTADSRGIGIGDHFGRFYWLELRALP